jgi:RNA polymerase sigma factor (sigma-70 family)
MAASELNEIMQQLRWSVLLREGEGLTDGQLLGRFVEERDAVAFAGLVRRHGPMVWGVSRRLLSQHDAEDAFQATFLVLVRKAASVLPRERVANWLYGVAHQTALQARRNAARSRAREKQVIEMPEPAAAEQNFWSDLPSVLDQELSRLPDAYREVIVLSELEGKSRKEVARQLGVPEGTVASRLARARTMLAKRLTRQGITFTGASLAAVLSRQAAACVPHSVANVTIKAASLLAAGETAATGAISLKVAALTEGVMKTMFFAKLRTMSAIVTLLVFAATLMTVLAYRTAAQGDKLPVAEKPGPAARTPPPSKQSGNRLTLTLTADKAETRMDPAAEYGASPVKLKLTFTNAGDKPVKLDAYLLPTRIEFHCQGPGPDSVKKVLELIDAGAAKPATEKDYPVIPPGKSWSPSWMPAFPGDIPEGPGAVAGYWLRQPGTYKLRMTVYDRYAPHVEGATKGTKLYESDELEVKVREPKASTPQERDASAANLKELALAMNFYNSDKGHFPPAAVFSKDGKALLSWRVLLLPYLEQKALFDEFKLDEPWDSPHNRKLQARMPKVFAAPDAAGKAAQETFCQMFAGKGTIFDGQKGTPITDIRDGTSNTILIIEGGAAVPWTQPADLDFDAKKALARVGGMFSEGFHFARADASVYFCRPRFREAALRAMITRSGGEIVKGNPDDN